MHLLRARMTTLKTTSVLQEAVQKRAASQVMCCSSTCPTALIYTTVNCGFFFKDTFI